MRTKRRALILGALLGVAVAGTAPRVAAQGEPPATATEEQTSEARKLFMRGQDRLDVGKEDEALDLFRQSYGVVASPNSHLMVARMLAELGRDVEAYAEYEATIAEADEAAKADEKYAKTAATARDELQALQKKVGLVTLTVTGDTDGASLKVGDRKIDKEHWADPIAVAPGSVVVVLTAVDGRAVTKNVDAAAGATAAVTLEAPSMAPEPEPEPPAETATASFDSSTATARQWAWITGGVGVAGVASFAIFGLLSQKKFDDLKKDCPTRQSCDRSLKSDADKGQMFQNVANGSLVLGAAGLGASVALFFTTKGPSEEQARTSRRPQVAVGPGSVVVHGRF